MSSNRTSDEWIAQYSRSHQHPVNQFCHMIGIPVIVGALVLAAVGAWRLALAAFVVGWIFQFVGHAFEGKPPEFFSNWRFLLVGLRWWVAKIRGRSQASRLASMRPDPEAWFGGTLELDLNTHQACELGRGRHAVLRCTYEVLIFGPDAARAPRGPRVRHRSRSGGAAAFTERPRGRRDLVAGSWPKVCRPLSGRCC